MTTSSTTSLPNWLARCAENTPTRLAVQCGSIRWSFADLDAQATRLARQFAGAGVREGSHVALLANGLAFLACVHALMRLGAILVPLNTRLAEEELRWQIQDVGATHLVSDSSNAGLATALVQSLPNLPHLLLLTQDSSVTLQGLYEVDGVLKAQIDLAAPHMIMYTSGTTGHPKGVIITYGMQWWNAIGSALNMGHQLDDRWLACLPLFHIGGLSILMKNVIYGISILVHEKFDARAVNQAIHEERVTIISVVATMLQRMLDDLDMRHMQYPSTLRCVLLGGGPAPRTLLEECTNRNIPVLQTYGLTEACSQAVTLSPNDALRKLGSAGRPLLPVQLRILEDDIPAAPGEVGEIYLKGPTITPGYINHPEETQQAFWDGWFCSGDLGYLDTDGYLYVLDRRTDLIVSGGENIYPAEIEAVMLAHPGVQEVGVCGREDEQWGKVPVAFVRLHPGHRVDEEELLDYARQRLARYKIPRTIYFVDELPHNAAGKLLRRELHSLLPPA